MKTVILGLLIPFIGTAAGAACVFFVKGNLNRQLQRALTGEAAAFRRAADQHAEQIFEIADIDEASGADVLIPEIKQRL